MTIASARFRVRGWHVLAALLAFFGAIIGVNVAFAVIAVSSFPGEDVRRSYLQGLQYNDTLAARRAQAALGWRADAALAPGEGGGAALVVDVFARDGAALDGAALTGALQWPTTARFDHQLAFVDEGRGRYRAELGDLPRGRWRLRARAEREGESLDFESEVVWP